MGLIVGGALGNITDRLVMAKIGGYGGVLDGHVVDFIHFTLTIGDWAVFPYIFNVADIAISTAIIVIILFHKKIIPVEEVPGEEETDGKRADSGLSHGEQKGGDGFPEVGKTDGFSADSAEDSSLLK